MGEAKRKAEKKKELWKESSKVVEKFNSVKNFPPFTPSAGKNNLHAVKAYHHLMRQIFLRAKHLHESLLEAVKKNDSYSSFVLLKAYWETVAMLGYVYISAGNYIKDEKYKELLDWATKHALGGKKFPPDDLIQAKGRTREDFLQTNLLTWMRKMDKDFDKVVRRGKNFSEFEKVYDEFIAEAGHSTFLGLTICEKRLADGSVVPIVDKTHEPNDDMMTLNHTSLASHYMFYYWNKFVKEVDKQIKVVI